MSAQSAFFKIAPRFGGTRITFDGDALEPQDHPRLSVQLQAVYDLLSDGQPHTLAEIGQAVGAPQQSVSARIRDLRKARFGAHTIERERIESGLYTYRLVP